MGEVYRSENLSCPICNALLREAPASLPVSGCATCGGAWLGPEAAVHLLRDEEDDVTREVVEAGERISQQALSCVVSEGNRPCARCGQMMHRIDVGHVRLDCCPSHGTWFDREEVKKCASELHRMRHPDELQIVIARITLPFRRVAKLLWEYLES